MNSHKQSGIYTIQLMKYGGQGATEEKEFGNMRIFE